MNDFEDINHLLIMANLVNEYEIDEPFHFYVKAESPASSVDYDQVGSDIWLYGKGVEIDLDNKIAQNRNYYVLVEAPKNAIIKITSKGYGENRKFYLQNKVYDLI
jgi:hypothetical protein